MAFPPPLRTVIGSHHPGGIPRIGSTVRNPAAIPPFAGGFSDPPTLGEMQAFAAYVEALRAALVR